MIAKQDPKNDIWSRLAAPLPASAISWRQDGKPTMRDGKYLARFVAYIDAQFVRERLDSVVPGEWDLTLDVLPPMPSTSADGVVTDEPYAIKARLQVLGVIREDVGQGRDLKTAATDAFKRAAVRFGLASELYAYEQNWVQVDGDGRYARPLEDPGAAYKRRYGSHDAAVQQQIDNDRAVLDAAKQHLDLVPVTDPPRDALAEPHEQFVGTRAPAAPAETEPACPKCGGRMWDNRATKRNPKAPNYKCRDKSCDGVVWPPRVGEAPAAATVPAFEGDPGDSALPF